MGMTPSREIAVWEGRIPKAPLLAAGSRTEPPLRDTNQQIHNKKSEIPTCRNR